MNELSHAGESSLTDLSGAIRAWKKKLKERDANWRAYVAAVDVKDEKKATEIDRVRGTLTWEVDVLRRAVERLLLLEE